MMDIDSRDSYRQLFKTLGILPLKTQYIYSSLCFMVNNMDSYQFISGIHTRNTRQVYNLNLFQPSAHLSLSKGSFYMDIKVFNNIPVYIKQLYNNYKVLNWLGKIFIFAIHFRH
jgi:hypothetical protein